MQTSQQWWPAFLFHCTDVRNVVNILRTGEMLSRTRALTLRQLQVDIASEEIIARTDKTWQDYVRLYFRPKTPTQYRNEGFRPVVQQYHQAQCPVPVYLLFNALDVLSEADVLFTDGSVANGAQPASAIEFFKDLPFEKVYHDTWFGRSERDEIVYHRHAEVLVPERLSTFAIRFIYCRSQAEYDTLLNLLSPGQLSHWADRIGVRPDLNLFHRQWCFVERVELNRAAVLFRFNVGNSPGPFKARAELIESFTGLRYTWQSNEFTVSDPFGLSLMNFRHPQDYSIQFFLDDQLAYSGRFQDEPLPF